MRALLIVVVLLIVGIVGVGFYRGWFQVSSNRDSEDQKVNTTFTIDEERIGEDKEKLQGFADQAKDEPAETSEETK
jgi:cytoskeletal protein RodZ